MSFFLFRVCSWYVWTACSAALEVNIEGPHGWAASLPTPRRTTGGILLRIVQRFVMGGRPVTGYHACMLMLQFSAFNVLPYAAGLPFTRTNVCLGLSVFFLSCATWDFLWFVLNPSYGLKKFTKEHVGWHAHHRWIFGLFPVDYAVAAVLSVALSSLAVHQTGEPLNFVTLAAAYVIWGTLVLFTVSDIGPWYRRRRVRLLAGNDPPVIEENVDEGHDDDATKNDSSEAG